MHVTDMGLDKKRSIIDITHVSSLGTSYRITLPKKVAESIGLTKDDNIVVFYKEQDGIISIDKLRQD